jgi:hypothetical protein
MRAIELDNRSRRFATRHFSKAVTLLLRAGKQLDAASRTAPDKYHTERLQFLAAGLRDVTLPLSKIASCLQKGGGR